jgi:hypothetical protein
MPLLEASDFHFRNTFIVVTTKQSYSQIKLFIDRFNNCSALIEMNFFLSLSLCMTLVAAIINNPEENLNLGRIDHIVGKHNESFIYVYHQEALVCS